VIYDDPSLLEEVLDSWLSLYEELLRKLTAHVRVDVLLLWEDMCYKNGPLIGPSTSGIHDPALSQARGGGSQLRRQGGHRGYDGDCRKLIPLFLDVGVDCMMPFEVQAGMDVVAIGKQYPELALWED